MIKIVSEIDSKRQIGIEEVPGVDGRVFLMLYQGDWHAKRDKPAHVLELDKAELVIALRDLFGLVDPLELALAAS
ncbi:MAG: hypothetical protein CMH36_11430 [Microbacterium sp.]|uniref:Uncharacterized protein n=1 Tax=Microbacterium ginsengisoli TaxID=400772 RepID=A0A3C1KE65_9MICO|nr:hypothetical protein [uncultured Microbacterium sp.]MAL07418.1 hypothetical protein [Microbacterium sp.]HAN24945.1 hypothetical protein [Microbacterium ginsengisoli]